MTVKPRSIKAEQAKLSAQLRAEGMTWPEIAIVFQGRYRINARVALRLVHGWSQQDAADHWNERWPSENKTFKNFSYWEQWPSPTGYEPSLAVLAKLAELYRCRVVDLLSDAPDFRNQDVMYRAQENLNIFKKTVSGDVPTPSTREIIPQSDKDQLETATEFVNRIQGTDVNELATMASTRARKLDSSDDQSSLLFKLSFALTLAAANPTLEKRTADMTASDTHGNPDLSGIWRSRYSYFSSGRGQEFDSTHYVAIQQSGQQITVESLPHPSGSKIKLNLTADGFTITGTWEEQTSPTGYYKGTVYRGAIQLLASPTGGQLLGKWIGFGKNFRINTGDWEFVLETRITSDENISRYTTREDD